MIESFDDPLVVIALDEGFDDPAGLLQALEAMEPEALFLQRADEAFDDAVALRLPDIRVAMGDPQPGQLIAEGIRDVLRAPIAPHGQAARDVLGEGAEGQACAGANRLERGPSIANLGRVPS